MAPVSRRLPAPGVQFEPDFSARVGALQLRIASSRQSREGLGVAQQSGAGADLVGYRPYRPGEDLRQLDWSLLARLDRPFVRVTRREAGELWSVVLDASASMGVGPPGKLQRGAECAAALAAVGGRLGVDVRLVLSDGEGGAPRLFEGRQREGPGPVISFLEEQQARGDRGLGALLGNPSWARGASRLFLIGDLSDLRARDVLSLRQAGRSVAFLQLAAPQELDPEAGGVEWWDPEGDQVLHLDVSEADCSHYHQLLEERLESWRAMASRHRVAFSCRSTREAFEDLVAWLLES